MPRIRQPPAASPHWTLHTLHVPCRRCPLATSQSPGEKARRPFARRLLGRGRPPGSDGCVAGCPRPAGVCGEHGSPRTLTFLRPPPLTAPSRLPPGAPPRRLPRTWAGAKGAESPAGAEPGGGRGLGVMGVTWRYGRGECVGGGAIRAAPGLRAAPSRAGGSGGGARQRRGDWLRRPETSGSRGPSGRPARRGAVGSSGLVTESRPRPRRPPPPSPGCAAAVARTRRRAPRRLQPRGLRSPHLPHAHHDED